MVTFMFLRCLQDPCIIRSKQSIGFVKIISAGYREYNFAITIYPGCMGRTIYQLGHNKLHDIYILYKPTIHFSFNTIPFLTNFPFTLFKTIIQSYILLTLAHNLFIFTFCTPHNYIQFHSIGYFLIFLLFDFILLKSDLITD